MKVIYVAGPLGFSEAGRDFYYNVLLPHLKSFGVKILDPWRLTESSKIEAVREMPYGEARRAARKSLNEKIAGNNSAAMDECRGVFAILDGPDVDSGTAAEVGYVFAKGKPIVGYRGDFRLSGDNEGSTMNLQVEFFILRSGGTIISQLSEARSAFERTIQQSLR